jgi:hypothetical protein
MYIAEEKGVTVNDLPALPWMESRNRQWEVRVEGQDRKYVLWVECQNPFRPGEGPLRGLIQAWGESGYLYDSILSYDSEESMLAVEKWATDNGIITEEDCC